MSDAGPPDAPRNPGSPVPDPAPAPLYHCLVYPAGPLPPALAAAAPVPPPTPLMSRGVPVWLVVLVAVLLPFAVPFLTAKGPPVNPVVPVVPAPVDPAVKPVPPPVVPAPLPRPPPVVPVPAPSDPALAKLAAAAATYETAFADAHQTIAARIDSGAIANKGQLRDALVQARAAARAPFVALFDAAVDAHCDPNGVFQDKAAVAAAVRAVGVALKGGAPRTGEAD